MVCTCVWCLYIPGRSNVKIIHVSGIESSNVYIKCYYNKPTIGLVSLIDPFGRQWRTFPVSWLTSCGCSPRWRRPVISWQPWQNLMKSRRIFEISPQLFFAIAVLSLFFLTFSYITSNAFQIVEAHTVPMHTYNLTRCSPRSIDKVSEFRSNLMKYHDEIADLKSYFDGRGTDTYDQQTLHWTLNVCVHTCIVFRGIPLVSLIELPGRWTSCSKSLKRLKPSYGPSWNTPSYICFLKWMLLFLDFGGDIIWTFWPIPTVLSNPAPRSSRALMEDTKLRKCGAD